MVCATRSCGHTAVWIVTIATVTKRKICQKCYETEGWDKGPYAEGCEPRLIGKEGETVSKQKPKLPKDQETKELVMAKLELIAQPSIPKLALKMGVSHQTLRTWDKAMGHPVKKYLDGLEVEPLVEMEPELDDLDVTPAEEKKIIKAVSTANDSHEAISALYSETRLLREEEEGKMKRAEAAMKRCDRMLALIDELAGIMASHP